MELGDSVLAATVTAALEGFEALGGPIDDMCADLGIDRGLLADPTGRVPTVWMADMWGVGARYLDLEALAVRVGLAVPLGAFGMVDYLVASADNVGSALETLIARFGGMASRLTFALDRDQRTLEVVGGPLPVYDGSEFAIAVALNRLRTLTLGPVDIEEVALSRPEPNALYATLLEAPVRFGAPVSRISFGASLLSRLNRRADPKLFSSLDVLADKLGIGPSGPHFETALRTELRERLEEGEIQAGVVARALGLSERSFYRRLAASGLTFRGSLDRVRATEAERLLLTGLPVAEVAGAVGYSDQAAFSRAFRRWRGDTPVRWRDQALGL